MGTIANLIVRIGADVASLDKVFTGLEKGAAAVQKKYEALGAQLQGVGAKMTAGLTVPILGFGAAAAKTFIDFESAMKGVEAALVPTGVELKALEAAAIEWGAKTKFSATDSAVALGELGKAGFTVGQSIGALPSVLQLATVSGLGLEQAATLTADTLKQFGLGVSEAARVNDVLTKAAQMSTVDVAQLGESLKYAGPVAAALGLSFEGTNAALAAFGNVGIKADMAGTALRNVLGDIVNPTKALSDVLAKLGIDTLVSSDGTIKLAEVIDRLKAAGATGGDVLKAFGDRAGPGMVALVAQGSAGIRELDTALMGAGGTAQRAADVQMSGLGGALEQLRGSFETAGIAVGSVLAPALTAAATALGRITEFVTTQLVPAFKALPAPVQIAVGTFLAIAAAVGPIVYVAGTLISTWGAVAGAFAAGTAGAKIAIGVFGFLTGPIGLTIAAVVALVAGLRWLTGSWEGVLRVLTLGLLDFGRVSAMWELLKTGAAYLVAGLQALGGYIGGALMAAWSTLRGVLVDVAESGFGRLVRAVGEFVAKAAGWTVITVAVVQWEALKGALWLVGQAFSYVWGLVQPIAAWFNGVLTQAIGAVWSQFVQLANTLGGAVVAAFRFVVEWLDKLAGKAADVINWLSRTIPGFDKVAGAAKATGEAVATFGGKVFASGTQAAAGAAGVAVLAATVGAVAPAAAAAVPPLARVSTAASTAGKEAERAASKIKDLADALSGKDAIAGAEDYLKALKALPAGARLTVDAMARVHGALTDALEAYEALGKAAPAEMRKVWNATIAAPEIEKSIMRALAGVNWEAVRAGIVGRSINVGIVGLAPAVAPTFGIAAGVSAELTAARELTAAWSADMSASLSNAFAGAITGVSSWSDAVKGIFGQLQGWVTNLIGGIGNSLITGLGKSLSGQGGMLESIKGVGSQMKALGESSKLIKYGGGAAVGGVIGYGVGSKYGGTKGVLAGAASGAATGAAFGGVYGAAIGAGVGAIAGWWGGRQKKKQEQKDMAADREELVKLYGGMEKLRDAASRFGVDIDKAFDTKKPKEYAKIVGEFASKLEAEEKTIEKIAAGLQSVSDSGGLVGKALMTQIASAPPGSNEDLFAFIGEQSDKALSGIGVYLEKATIKTQGGATAIAGSIAAMYDELQRQGVPATEAIRQLTPLITNFGTAAAGIVGGQVPAAFTTLQAFATLAADEIAGPMFDAVAGLGQGLTAVNNLGLLNQDTFAGFAGEITASYKALEIQGKGGELAMQGMRGALQTVFELQADFGYQVDEDTQGLLDFAENAGLVGDKFRPAADRMVIAIEAMVDRFDTFLDRIGETAGAAAAAAADAGKAFSQIELPVLTIPTRYGYPGNPYNDDEGAGSRPPALAAGGIVRRPTVALIGEAGPEAVVPLSGAGFNTTQEAAIYLDGDVIARAVLRRQGRILKSYGAIR